MIYKYAFKAGATNANILADVCKLIAGGALNTLSADCVQGSSTETGVASGWQIDDAANGIVSAATLGGGRKVYQLSIAANVLKAAACESWNAATHVGTNVCTAQGLPSVASASAGALWIYATPEVVALYDSALNWIVLGEVVQLGRLLDAARPVAVVFDRGNVSAMTCRMPRVKTYNAAGDTTNAGLNMVTQIGPNNAQLRGDSEIFYYQMQDCLISVNTTASSLVLVGKVRGCQTVPAIGATGDIWIDDAAAQAVNLASFGGQVGFSARRA